MSALNAAMAGAGRVGRARLAVPVRFSGLAGRRPRGLAVPLLVAGALAAGCGSGSGGGVAGGTAERGAPTHGPVHSTGTATPIASATPVPTVSGGPVATGGVGCAGWPTGVPSTALSASFVPVSVERCVNGTETIPGKGLWTTATLERSASDLSRLVIALRKRRSKA